MRKLMVAVALAVLAGLVDAQAQTFPSRPITLVLALPAGGAVDALARIMVEHMRGTLCQPVIIENMGGAGGTLSIARVVRSAPDGYTLGMGTLGQYVISGAVYTLPFDMLADLAPVALLPNVPYWMAMRKTLPANNLRELATWLKSNNGSAASTGTASMARFCGMGFEKAQIISLVVGAICVATGVALYATSRGRVTTEPVVARSGAGANFQLTF